jgi:indolepyruvate decarboxylase
MVKTDEFRAMASQSCCVSYVATDPGLVAIEMDRVISTALREKRPAYVAVPKDVGKMQIPEDIAPSGRKTLSIDLRTASSPSSVEAELKAAVLAVKNRLTRSKSPIVLVSFMCQRLGLVGKVTQLIEKLNLKFVLTSMDKGTMPESHPNYIGLYKGEASCASVVNAVNNSDLVIDLGGVLFDDLSTGFGTSMILKKDMITIGHTVTTLGDDSMDRIQEHPRSYGPVFLGDVLDALLGDESLAAFPSRDIPSPLPWPEYNSIAPGITYASIASSLQQFLKPDDVFVLETGTCSLFLSNLLLPENCAYMNQTLWGSIGWGTPACFGACLAAPDRQVVFVTGDGSHQLTANEIGAMQRYGTSPIVLVLNNGLFGVEEFLEKNAMKEYNVIADWKYADVARAMGTAWECVKVDTIQGLQEALTKARSEEKGTYIEVMMSEKLLDPLTSSALSKEYMDRP